MRVHQVSVVHRLADDPADEFEVAQMVFVDRGVTVWLVRAVAGGGQLEQAVVGVEHLARQEHVPLAREAAGVDALLPAELDGQTPAHLFRV